MNKPYCVYKHTTPDGRVYIGITNQEPEKRWGGGWGYEKQQFFSIILKYGWDNITHEILYSNLSKKEAELLEIELIDHYKSRDINYGFNISHGGNLTQLGKKLSEETKQKISKANKGRKHSDEVRKRLSESHKGKKQSEETIQKRANKNKRPVICLETNKIYDSVKTAAELTSTSRTALSQALTGKYKTAGGFHWNYAESRLLYGE